MVDLISGKALVKNMLGFDPFGDLCVAQKAKPAHLSEINLRVLTPFQRALLVIDGNVTKFIEAYELEPVEIIRLAQERRTLPVDHPWLEAPQGTPVIARQVVLRGSYTYVLYVYAASLIVPDRLSSDLQRLLEVEGEGLGRILLNYRLETYREVLWYGKEHIDELPEAIRHLSGLEFITRTYRIIAGGQPIMLINEKFPSSIDQLPSHE